MSSSEKEEKCPYCNAILERDYSIHWRTEYHCKVCDKWFTNGW